MMIRQLQRMVNTTTAVECLVFVVCFWIAHAILQATINIDLIFHSLLFSFVLLLSVRMIAPMLIKPAATSNLIFQRLRINAIGLLISASILLFLGILLAWPYVATTILASILVFFVLGTLSPLQSKNTITH
jgi:hypothetical protein